ncbi:acyl-CoA carboxylase subunit epsilon [Demequina zhanjiangensis]|uniref:Acyl-CoA carboxylase subunit epsilon n=1 Tax=Demequina zhanjiangensis TaxID=3051659 RepID=A0ABT8G124_9MICO|nr:acyl-CoA carboxylase subunit epsilon [Demequina sp. SYSU T00b26]MDN4472845.1 acyl-CoA carboxylase subunit epsilon [Demequina sp. SYSU T00b26]
MNGDEMVEAAASLRVVRGAPDESELAALVAGMVAVASAHASEEGPGAPSSAWMDRTRRMQGRRLMLPLGRGDSAWRHSLR